MSACLACLRGAESLIYLSEDVYRFQFQDEETFITFSSMVLSPSLETSGQSFHTSQTEYLIVEPFETLVLLLLTWQNNRSNPFSSFVLLFFYYPQITQIGWRRFDAETSGVQCQKINCRKLSATLMGKCFVSVKDYSEILAWILASITGALPSVLCCLLALVWHPPPHGLMCLRRPPKLRNLYLKPGLKSWYLFFIFCHHSVF